jgi:hydroxyacylglutathione hydrolase
MIHEVFPVGPLQCNCSVIGDESSREAMVVDPGDDIADVLSVIAKHNLKVTRIYVTHAHIDHIGGAMKLKAATGAPITMHAADEMQLPLLDMQAQWVGMRPPGTVTIDEHAKDTHAFRIGNVEARVLHTPGHTEGSSCIYIPGGCCTLPVIRKEARVSTFPANRN